MTGCTCGDRVPTDMYGPAWLGGHLAGLDAPDYMQTYWDTWATHVEAPAGAIDRDAVARELFDYGFVMEQVSTVYCELADLSNSNYHASAILGVINDRQEKHYREHYAERLCDRADEIEAGAVREELHRLAEEWSPGALEDYRRDQERIANMMASLPATNAPTA